MILQSTAASLLRGEVELICSADRTLGQQVGDLFDAIDADSDGLVTTDELKNALNDAAQPQLMKYIKSVGGTPERAFGQVWFRSGRRLSLYDIDCCDSSI